MIFFDQSPPNRRFFVPEVVQTSAMDCGPATLKSLLEGFGISVSYGRLREACQTDVDGTSIDVMEDVAVQLGLEAEQAMIPADHLLVPETQILPAIVIIRLPNGLTHFVVAWRLHGGIVQLMDPGKGRRWQTYRQFLNELYIHTHPIPAKDWREWAGTEGFCDPLSYRIKALGVNTLKTQRLIDIASQDSGWYSLASLDAATRMTDAIVRAEGLQRGKEAEKVLDAFFMKAKQDFDNGNKIIPYPYWSVQPKPPQPDAEKDSEEFVLLKGAVLVRVSGRRSEAKDEIKEKKSRLSPELVAALEEKTPRPEIEILKFLKEDGFLTPSVLSYALLMSTFCVTVEALLFRGLLDIGHTLNLFEQRLGAFAMLFVFLIAMLMLEFPISSIMNRIGRRIETRFRIAVLKKIPRLSDRYFHSRLTSDMTQRIHELSSIRGLPGMGIGLMRLTFQIILTILAIIFIVPQSAGIAVLAAIFSIGMSFIFQPLLTEQDLRLRTHVGAMSHFYLDALQGLIPIRTHCAERAVRSEHENLLVEWVHTGMDFLKITTLIGIIEALIDTGFAVWILFDYIAKGGQPAGILLLFYWIMSLPSLGKSAAGFFQQYPAYRNRILRLIEPLNAPEETEILDNDEQKQTEKKEEQESKGVSITLDHVSVVAGGQTILSDIDFSVYAGEHIAIVGSSGAGKSSLVGLFLGWHRPASGKLWVNGNLLRGEHLQNLRRQTAWVDPEVRIWNSSLYENLHYGTYNSDAFPLTTVIEQADLFGVLENLPNGMQTKLGEGGGLVSGGEGQRVRLGRGMLRSGIKLVILDEPFRGLDREKRRILLKRAREHWKNATLIFISHDVGEALTFDRVLVIENGQLIEHNSPATLAENPDSRYRALIESEEVVRKTIWESAEWRHLWLENGKVEEKIKN